MRTITIDCSDVSAEAEFWARYLSATGAEGAIHFGRNLNAFWDALNGGPGWPGECEVRISNTRAMSFTDADKFIGALRVLANRSAHVKVTVT